MADKIGAIEIEVTASPDSDRKMEAAGKKSGQKWADSFIKSLKDKVDKSAETPLGKKLFGSQVFINNQSVGYQGGILSGAANSINKDSLLKLGLIAGGIGAAVGILAEMSPALKKQLGMFGSAMALFFRPFGDMLATLLRPALIWLIKMGALWNQFFGKGPGKDILSALWGLTPMELPDTIKKSIGVLSDPKTWDDISATLAKAWDKMRLAAGDIAGHVYNLWTWLWDKASEVWEGIKSTIKTIWDGLASIITTPLQKVVDFVNGITWPSWLGGGGSSGGGSSGSGDSSGGGNTGPWFDQPGSGGGGVPISDLGPSTGSDYGWWNNVIPGLASGGIVTQPQLAIVGESGPEAIIPLSKFKGGGTTVNIEVNIQATDKAQIINEVTRKLSMELQRRLSVYG